MTSLKGLKPKTISLGNEKKKIAKKLNKICDWPQPIFFYRYVKYLYEKSKALLKNLKSYKLLN